jgi:transposase
MIASPTIPTTAAPTLIPIEHVWLSLAPTDMRSGMDSLLARVVQSCAGGAVQHSAYIFTNKAASRLKVLVYDGAGIWLCTRRLQSGRFVLPRDEAGQLAISGHQLQWLIAGAPWQHLGNPQAITVV